MFSPLEQFDAIRLVNIVVGVYDFSFLNILLPLCLLIIIFYIVNKLLSSNLQLISTGFQKIFEVLIEFIFNLIKQQLNINGYIFFPLIFTLFNFVLLSNLIGLIPFGIALTSHFIMMLWLSLSLCLSIFIYVS